MTPAENPRCRLFWVAWAGLEVALAVLLGCVLTLEAQAQTNYRRLKSFGSSEFSGILPASALVEGRDGALYGTTLEGGNESFDYDYSGTVFRLNKDGSGARVLHIFGHDDPGGGVFPRGGLIEGDDGVLYGVAQGGGTNDGGTVFRLNRDGGGFQVLHTFLAESGDGAEPAGGLMQSTDGRLYGTTLLGGSNNFGTIFRLDTSGSNYVVLHRFIDAELGFHPLANVIEGSDGALYGTTSEGGSNNSAGTVFTLNKDGSGYRVLHHFAGEIGYGAAPSARLLEGSDGVLYGTTDYGGEDVPSGIVFKINKDGEGFTVLLEFSDGIGDGNYRPSKLIEGPDGVLYGATLGGGVHDSGLVFRMNKDGSGVAGLHHFPEASGDGVAPDAALLMGSDGALYGTTLQGGESNWGIVFKLFSSQPRTFITRLEAATISMQLSVSDGAANQSYQIEATINLNDVSAWQVIGVRTADVDGRFQFLDRDAALYPTRFYRIETP